jgi:hypothetical protein
MENIDATQPNTASPTSSPGGNDHIKSTNSTGAKFINHMQGKKVDSSTSSRSLDDRSAASTGPQGTAASAPAQGTGADAAL